MQHGAALARESGDPALAEAVASGEIDGLDDRLRALLRYAVKLTRSPEWMSEADVARLRASGLDDRAIVDANQVVAYFNYVNRVADGLGVELEPAWPDRFRRPRSYGANVLSDEVPWLSVDQMRELDRIAIEELGLTLERMMENAGRGLAAVAQTLLGGSVAGRAVAVLAGPGGNGGGGLVAARHLAAAGTNVRVFLATPAARLKPVSLSQYEILARIGLPASVGGRDLGSTDLVVDALLGYAQAGPPRGEVARLIERTAGRRVLSLDVPSGLELETGQLHDSHVRAEATLALAAPKSGLRSAGARDVVGELYLGDLSIPPIAYERVGTTYRSPFGRTSIVRVT